VLHLRIIINSRIENWKLGQIIDQYNPRSYETLFAIEKAKRGKSAGFDNLPSETFLNQCSVLFLHHLFDYCFTDAIRHAVELEAFNKAELKRNEGGWYLRSAAE
jgi:hypothetical protein